MIVNTYDESGRAVSLLLMRTSQGIRNKLRKAKWRPLVTRRITSLMAGRRHAYRTHQEDADDACASFQAFNISTLNVSPGATSISGEAATPHAHLLTRPLKS
jgi:hypothetical protein